MNHRRSAFGAVVTILVVGLVGCVPDAATALVGRKVPVMESASAPAAGVAADPSVPDAATTFATQAAADRAKAPTPSTMTAEQESKAMPMPGQANDHSTTARDKQPGK